MEKPKHFHEKYDVIIVGAALAGLSSALTLAKAGKKVLVLEQHNLPGGVATSFVRGGVEMEASLHEMMSIGKKEAHRTMRSFFNEHNIDIEWMQIPDAYRYHGNGLDVLVHASYDGDMSVPAKDIASIVDDPKGKIYKRVKKFLDLCKKISKSVDAISGKKVRKLKMVFGHPALVLTAGYSASTVLKAFRLPKEVEEVLSAYWLYLGTPPWDLPFTVFGYAVGEYLGYGAYVPRHTSYEMSLKMAEKALEYGAQIEYKQRVDKILVKDNKAYGVTTESGETIYSDFVICGAYPQTAYKKLVYPESEVPKKAIKNANSREIALTCFSIVMVLDKTYKEIGVKDYSSFVLADGCTQKEAWDSLSTEGPYKYYATTCTNIAVPDCSPEGTCVYTITALPRPEGWMNVTEENYESIKNANVEFLLENESKRLGFDIRKHILEIVVETPVSVAHYTGAWRGSVYGYRHSMKDHVVARTVQEANEGYIQNLLFTGAHGVSGDGMAPCIGNGKSIAQKALDLLRRRKKK